MSSKVAALIMTLALAPVAAQATSLSVVGGTADTLPSNFDPAGVDASIGDNITAFAGGTNELIGGGLSLSGEAQLTFTFLGKEAGAQNQVSAGAGSSLSNRGAVGSAFSISSGAGLVDFSFSTILNGDIFSITNGGTSEFGSLALAFGEVFNDGRSVLAFFGDGRGDSDYDDMVVRIDTFELPAVPLPAGAALLMSGLIGLGVARRRRRSAS